jgi:hypothetical protein
MVEFGPESARMRLIVQMFAWGMLAWLALLAAFIAVRVMRGDMVLWGMLAQKPGGPPTPERMLGLVITIVIAVVYVKTALQIDLSGPGPIRLPELPEHFLNILLGTNGIFLAGKIARSS